MLTLSSGKIKLLLLEREYTDRDTHKTQTHMHMYALVHLHIYMYILRYSYWVGNKFVHSVASYGKPEQTFGQPNYICSCIPMHAYILNSYGK